jgi:hypothetical protein
MEIFTHNLLETTFWEKVEPKFMRIQCEFNANSMRIQCYFGSTFFTPFLI